MLSHVFKIIWTQSSINADNLVLRNTTDYCWNDHEYIFLSFCLCPKMWSIKIFLPNSHRYINFILIETLIWHLRKIYSCIGGDNLGKTWFVLIKFKWGENDDHESKIVLKNLKILGKKEHNSRAQGYWALSTFFCQNWDMHILKFVRTYSIYVWPRFSYYFIFKLNTEYERLVCQWLYSHEPWLNERTNLWRYITDVIWYYDLMLLHQFWCLWKCSAFNKGIGLYPLLWMKYPRKKRYKDS